MNKIKIDYFSDTNTDISLEMRTAMMKAEVGNEVAGEDPTVNRLLEECCEILGQEASMFLPSGTMCNLIAYKAHIKNPGDYIILDETSHPLVTQSGLIAGAAHATPYPIKGVRGIFTKDQIEPLIIMEPRRNIPKFSVVSIEQTTNFGGGDIWPLEYINDICALCKKYDILTHLDGARLFNASIATGISVKDYCRHFNSVFIDFTKGLGAPMGAVLAGSKDFIERAWYYKFQLGGGMHKVGILAEACLFGLRYNVNKLEEDHKKASLLANMLNLIPQIEIYPELYKTNIIYFSVHSNQFNNSSFITRLLERGIRMSNIGGRIRAVTHAGISYTDISDTIESIYKIIG